MKEFWPIIIGTAVVAAVFAILWGTGNLRRLTHYIQETREELRKCSWPTWEELRGSTVLVLISIFGLGLFTVSVDFILAMLVNWVVKI